MLLTGESGTGKTAFLRFMSENTVPPSRILFLDHPCKNFDEYIEYFYSHFKLGINQDDFLEKCSRIRKFLRSPRSEQNQYVVIAVENAQHITPEVLQKLITLGDFKTGLALQFILVGPTELQLALRQHSKTYLADLITCWCQLTSLSEQETGRFIKQRLRAVGYKGKQLFPADAVRRIYFYTRGNPKLIKTLCGFALLNISLENFRQVSVGTIDEVAGSCIFPDNSSITASAGSHEPQAVTSNIQVESILRNTLSDSDPTVVTADITRYNELGIPTPNFKSRKRSKLAKNGQRPLNTGNLHSNRWHKLFRRD